MKKTALISGMVFISFLIISQGLYAQRFHRYETRIDNNYYDLELTREQLEKIDQLELELEKELSPLFSKLRANFEELDEEETQMRPDQLKIEKIWDRIYRLDDDIQDKEILHERKIRGLLTEDQKAVFDSYYRDEMGTYGRNELGRGYFGPGYRRDDRGYYGTRRSDYRVGIGRGYRGRGAGGMGRGYYGYGRGNSRGYGMRRGYSRLTAGRFSRSDYYRNFPRVRYGRGPCGAGLGKWDRRYYYRGRWNRNE
ncbi:Spy/CpxP family protein refolding chaperone [Acidobacteriota bacterium]